jgi:cell division protein FtsB
MFKRLLKFIGNKYFITVLLFAVWMVFFDNTNLQEQVRMSKQKKQFEKERDFYQEEIEKNRKAAEELTTDTVLLEKFARERYLMKRDNEDVYLMVRDEE